MSSKSPQLGLPGVVSSGVSPRKLPIDKVSEEMGIGANGPLVDRAFKEALPHQYDREVVKNAIEAGASYIEITPDWLHVEETGGEVYRYAVVDNGHGMTGDELVKYFNMISSSGKSIGPVDGNFGVGAKISLMPWNPKELLIMSWKDGEGSMIRIGKKPNGNYALLHWEVPDEDGESVYEPVVQPYEGYKEEFLKDSETGTIIVATGETGTEDTYLGPTYGDKKKSAIKVHSLALNTRFFDIPDEHEIRVFEFASGKKAHWPKQRVNAMPQGGMYRRVRGARYYLERHKETSGTVHVTGAKIHWWILKEDREDISQIAISRNFIAALFDNELYNISAGNEGRHHYQTFGVVYEKAFSRLTLVVEADHYNKGKLEGVFPNTPRSQLRYMGTPNGELPLKQWGGEFLEQMPDEVRTLCEEAAASSVKTGVDAKDKLKDYLHRLQSVQFRRALNGKFSVALNKPGGLGVKRTGTPPHKGISKPGGTGGPKGLFTSGGQVGPTPARKVTPSPDIPTAEWLYARDGSRSEGDDMEGRAARYVESTNLIQINGDFPLFREVTDYWVARYGGTPGAEEIVMRVVREVYELDLIAKVIQARAMKGTIHWASRWDQLVSEEALTMAVLGIVGTDHSIGTKVGGALGGARSRKVV